MLSECSIHAVLLVQYCVDCVEGHHFLPYPGVISLWHLDSSWYVAIVTNTLPTWHPTCSFSFLRRLSSLTCSAGSYEQVFTPLSLFRI